MICEEKYFSHYIFKLTNFHGLIAIFGNIFIDFVCVPVCDIVNSENDLSLVFLSRQFPTRPKDFLPIFCTFQYLSSLRILTGKIHPQIKLKLFFEYGHLGSWCIKSSI